MGSPFVEEMRLWNTPYIGAYYLWRFAKGYCAVKPEGAPLLFAFFLTAICTDPELYGPITLVKKLRNYRHWFIDKHKAGTLAHLQARVDEMRDYTFAALDRAVYGKLIVWHRESGTFSARVLAPEKGAAKLAADILRAGNAAEKLGGWFAMTDIATIASTLGVKLI